MAKDMKMSLKASNFNEIIMCHSSEHHFCYLVKHGWVCNGVRDLRRFYQWTCIKTYQNHYDHQGYIKCDIKSGY